MTQSSELLYLQEEIKDEKEARKRKQPGHPGGREALCLVWPVF